MNQNDSVAVHHLHSVYGRKTPVFPTAAGNLGVYFTTRRLDESEDMEANVTYEALLPQLNKYEPVVTAEGEWAKVSFTFEADQPYRFFTIGNFKHDRDTEVTLTNVAEIERNNSERKNFWKNEKRVAYYCLDDVRISILGEAQNPSLSESLTANKTYVFQHVSFASGKWELLPGSEKELDNLAVFLRNSPDVRIEIGGHTDSVGSAGANLLLSQKRAEALVAYLVKKGIGKSRMRWTGHGESQPIAPNGTPEGRAKNRRVEVEIR